MECCNFGTALQRQLPMFWCLMVSIVRYPNDHMGFLGFCKNIDIINVEWSCVGANLLQIAYIFMPLYFPECNVFREKFYIF